LNVFELWYFLYQIKSIIHADKIKLKKKYYNNGKMPKKKLTAIISYSRTDEIEDNKNY